jgi:hypothetical protein
MRATKEERVSGDYASSGQEERDAKNWLVSAQAGLIGAENVQPDPDGNEELALWIAIAQGNATVALVLKLEEIRKELEIMNRRDTPGGSDQSPPPHAGAEGD